MTDYIVIGRPDFVSLHQPPYNLVLTDFTGVGATVSATLGAADEARLISEGILGYSMVPVPSGDATGATDTPTIQSAIDAAHAAWLAAGSPQQLVTVKLPSAALFYVHRTWQVGATTVWGALKLRSGVDLNLNGATIKLADATVGNVTCCVVLNENAGTETIVTAGDTDIVVRDGILDGNAINQSGIDTGEIFNVLQLSRVTRAKVVNVKCRNAYASGIVVLGGDDVAIKDNALSVVHKFPVFVGSRTDFASPRIRIDNNYVDTFDHQGICVDGGYGEAVSDVRIRDNTVLNGTGTWTSFSGNGIHVEEGVTDFIISGNTCNENANYGITTQGGQTNTACVDGRITENYVSENGSTGIFCTYTTNTLIAENHATANTDHGIEATASGCKFLTIEDNRCYMNGKHGIVLIDVAYSEVRDNVCRQNGRTTPNTYDGILCQANSANAIGLLITGNHCYDDVAAVGSRYQKYGLAFVNNGGQYLQVTIKGDNDFGHNRIADVYWDGFDTATGIADLLIPTAENLLVASDGVAQTMSRRLLFSAVTPVAGTVYGWPAWVRWSATCQNIRAIVTTSFANVTDLRFGVWNDDGTLLASTANLGNLAFDANAVKVLALTDAIDVTTGQKLVLGFGGAGQTNGILRGNAGIHIAANKLAPRLARLATGYTGGTLPSLPDAGDVNVGTIWLELVA